MPVALTGVPPGMAPETPSVLMTPRPIGAGANVYRLFGRLPHAAAHSGRTLTHCGDDVVIAGAAADVAFQLLADGGLVELGPLAVNHVDGRHDHARRAEAALQAVVVAEGLLHGVQLRSLGETLDGRRSEEHT